MKKLLMLVAALNFVFVGAASVHASSVGDGTPGNPYQITTCTELQAMQSNLSASYVLANDIDCSATASWNGGRGFIPILGFSGTFDGQRHTITALWEHYPPSASTGELDPSNYVGLFGIANADSVVKNVGLENVHIVGVSGGIGGLVGVNVGAVSNSYVTGTVQGGYGVGGLVGINTGAGAIANSYTTASVYDTVDHGGGLVGANQEGATITNSYSTGSVAGAPPLGGLSSITYSGATITNSYWDTQTSGQSTSSGGTGKTTAEMKQQPTFAGWDFATVWGIDEGVSYPFLRWLVPNSSPVFDPVGDKVTDEGQLLQFIVVATDPDDDALTYSATGLPAGAAFDSAMRTFTWTPGFTQAGTYTVSFGVADDGVPSLSDTINVTITVSDIPTPVEQAQNLVNIVTGSSFPKSVENSYLANIKKVGTFIENGNITPAINQLNAFIKKVGQDYAKGTITLVQKNTLVSLAETLLEDLQ